MIVKIAGYNIDKSLIDKLDNPQEATPETISAAYARISRSSSTVTELRRQSLTEVAKARRSNETIIFDMGHSSIAEHAVYNLDIIGISRYLTEFVQKSRFASFTEKSQRYVTWSSDFITPPEIDNTSLKNRFREKISELFSLYKKLYQLSFEYYSQEFPDLKTKHRQEKAKEDARYVLPLATATQMGVTINARSLENLLRRLAVLDLEEARQLYEQLILQVMKISPSLIRYIEPDPYKKKIHSYNPVPFLDKDSGIPSPIRNTKIQVLTGDPEETILAGLLFHKVPQDLDQLIKKTKKLPPEKKEELFSYIFDDMKAYHQVPKSFELVECLVQTSVSASCFAQLKRHRLTTIIPSGYHPSYGYVVPGIIRETKSYEEYTEKLDSLVPVYQALEEMKEGLGSYILTNAHKINVIFKSNLRELYHFSRLRSDKHAQWEIRNLSLQIDSELRKVLPNAAKQMMGKDRYAE